MWAQTKRTINGALAAACMVTALAFIAPAAYASEGQGEIDPTIQQAAQEIAGEAPSEALEQSVGELDKDALLSDGEGEQASALQDASEKATGSIMSDAEKQTPAVAETVVGTSDSSKVVPADEPVSKTQSAAETDPETAAANDSDATTLPAVAATAQPSATATLAKPATATSVAPKPAVESSDTSATAASTKPAAAATSTGTTAAAVRPATTTATKTASASEKTPKPETDKKLQAQAQSTAASTSSATASSKNTADLVNGNIYVLYSGTAKNRALDLYGASRDDGANVQQYEFNRTKAQQWIARFTADGFVTFASVASGKVLDVAGGSNANGTNVWQYESNGTAAQKWRLAKNSDNTYTIFSALAGNKVLDIAGGSQANAANVQIYQSNGTKAQKWTLFNVSAMRAELAAKAAKAKGSVAAGTYYLASSVAIGPVADVAGGSRDDLANVQIYKTNETAAQKWTVSYASDGFAIIKNGSGKVLDVAGGNAENGTNVWQYASNGTLAQKWLLERKGDNTYRIVSALWKDVVLDVAGGSAKNGANLQVYASNGTAAQTWSFVPVKANVPATSQVTRGWYVLTSALNKSFAVDIAAAGTANGTNVQLYESNGTPAQLFDIIAQGKGYRLLAGASSTAVELASTSRMPGANVRIYARSATAASQLFSLVKNANSTYSVVNLTSGTALTVQGGKATNGANIQSQAFDARVKAQQFYLTRVEDLLPTGYVVIEPALATDKAVAVKGDSTANGAAIQVQAQTIGPLRKWKASKVSNRPNTYTFESLASGNYLQADAKGVVTQATKASSTSQYWQPSIVAGKYVLRNVGTGANLGFTGTAAKAGQVLSAAASTDAGHRFMVETVPLIEDGVYSFQNSADSKLVLEVAGGSFDDQANVQLGRSNGSGSQKWRVTKVSGNTYTVVNVQSWRALDVYGAQKVAGTNVWQYEQNGTPAQEWVITYAGAGKLRVASAVGGNLVLEAARSASAANVYIDSNDGTALQRWRMVRAEYVHALDQAIVDSLDGISLDGVTRVGIDVSEWQGSVDWARVKAAGIDYVILRCGFGSEAEGFGRMDHRFREYVAGCKANGIDMGVYLYSYTDNAKGATLEANYTLELLNELGLKPADLKYGVYYDVEEPSLNTSSMKATLRNMCANYCNRIKTAGYRVGVYSSLSWWNNYYDGDARFDAWGRWVAQWGPSRCGYQGNYEMWQCSSEANIPGISGNVDLDLYYK